MKANKPEEVRCNTPEEDGECEARLFDCDGKTIHVKCRQCNEVKEYDLLELLELNGKEILNLLS